MSIHDITIVGPHQSQGQLFAFLEANKELRPISISAVSGVSSAVHLELDNSFASERFMETVQSHDPSSVEVVSITTRRARDHSASYSVHRPGSSGWEDVLSAVKPPVHVRTLFMQADPSRPHDLLADLSSHFVDVTGKSLPGDAAAMREDGFISVPMGCSDDELDKILSRLTSAHPDLLVEARITEEGRPAGVGILEFLRRRHARGQVN